MLNLKRPIKYGNLLNTLLDIKRFPVVRSRYTTILKINTLSSETEGYVLAHHHETIVYVWYKIIDTGSVRQWRFPIKFNGRWKRDRCEMKDWEVIEVASLPSYTPYGFNAIAGLFINIFERPDIKNKKVRTKK